MIRNKGLLICTFFMVFILYGFQTAKDKAVYKCMIQMKNHSGQGAYIVVSLLDNESRYIETLYIQGNDDEWYSEITEWWKFQGKYRANVDAISGATVGAGQRSIHSFTIDTSFFDKGYKIRFETAVEDKEYFSNDIEIELSSVDVLQGKIEGKGYIRYIRLIPQF
tara:strand:- start:9638 stop:10132 length:495 start_codon:yes stop_codon:yes gene_type:complete